MNENTKERRTSTSGIETQTTQQLEPNDSPVSKVIESTSISAVCRRHFINAILVLWLLFLFAISTWFVVGCLSAHVFQSRFNHVLENRTVSNDVHIYIQYSMIKKTLRQIQLAKEKPVIDPETPDNIAVLDEQLGQLLAKLNDTNYGPDLLYLARAENTFEAICIPVTSNQSCLSGFIQIPRQLLVLLLTISMGVLGSLMRITRNYFDRKPDEEEAFSWYIFRPFLGAITALAVLILLKAGQLTITNASISSDTEGLNPFFISFLALISGFLSVQAHDRIRRAGATIFGTSQRPSVSRWLVKSRLKTLGSKDLVSLASYLGVSEEKVQKWFDLQEAVPESAQPIVAAWLDEPQQILFTDLKPQKKKVLTVNLDAEMPELEKTSEDTQKSLVQAGNTLNNKMQHSLDTHAGKDRWLISDLVQPLIKSRKLSALARISGVHEETVNAWLDNSEPVPQYYQQIIEAWLDVPEGGSPLFTDLDPRPCDINSDSKE